MNWKQKIMMLNKLYCEEIYFKNGEMIGIGSKNEQKILKLKCNYSEEIYIKVNFVELKRTKKFKNPKLFIDEDKLIIKDSDFKVKLNFIEEVISNNIGNNKKHIKRIKTKEFYNIFNKLYNFTDKKHDILKGILLDTTGNLVSTNSQVLIIYENFLKNFEEKILIGCFKKFIKKLKKFKGSFNLYYNKNYFYIENEEMTFLIGLIKSNFPKYENLFRNDLDFKLFFRNNELKNKLKKIKPFIKKGIIFDYENSVMKADYNSEAKIFIEGNFKDKLRVSYKHLKKLVDMNNQEKLVFYIKNNEEAIRCRINNFKILLMPMVLK